MNILENGVSGFPKLEGRFLQVSGLRFEWDPSKPPHERLIRETVTIKNKPVDLEKVPFEVTLRVIDLT